MGSDRIVRPRVDVIILNWNNPIDTLACLEALMASTYENFRVIVVDNASSDNSVAQIQAAFPDVTLLVNRENLGYAEGNNVGIRYSLQRECDYVCVLNNDTIVDASFLDELVSEAESAADIGMVGPKMYFFEPRDRIFAAGSFVIWDNGDLNHRGIWQTESAAKPLYDDRPEDVDFIVGCGVLVKREVIECIGALDPAYYLNYEDVEWGIRAKQAGYRVRYTPRAVLFHKVSASLGQASAANTYYMTRNALRFFGLYSTGSRRTQARIVFRTVRTVLAWSVRPKYRTSDYRQKGLANVYALRDYFLGRFGPMGNDVRRVCYDE